MFRSRYKEIDYGRFAQGNSSRFFNSLLPENFGKNLTVASAGARLLTRANRCRELVLGEIRSARHLRCSEKIVFEENFHGI